MDPARLYTNQIYTVSHTMGLRFIQRKIKDHGRLTMRKLSLYIATSLDGYIARQNESLDWLLNQRADDNGYTAFYDTIDTILLGRRTYQWILRNVHSEFPYQGKNCYVFSRTLKGQTANVQFVNQDIVTLTASLKKKPGKGIWIVGGGEVLSPLLRENLVDDLIIQIAPVIIGQGIRLFNPGPYEMALDLVKVTQYNQFVELQYQRK
jgi:dihydrofolate reductase